MMDIMPTNIAPPVPWWYAFLPLIIVGVVTIGIVCLIVVGILIGRRVTINLKTGGVVALTLASIILLSGLWCMFLTPTVTYSETKESFYRRISIDGLGAWSYPVSVQEGDTLFGSVEYIIKAYEGPPLPPPLSSVRTFNVRVYDPDDNIVWSETNVTYAYFNVKSSKSGVIKVEVRNPNQQAIESASKSP
ncbi:MAG: hypothetical protein AOA65_0370 [Candidatus Bathyarchaeota archaeon BA1]|nr:MAG: hypothetical protein AOA65_0370 [Candidatus Bathyarchaeota archaeon BA1]